MVFLTCSPTPSTTPIKVTVKCDFCYRENVKYLSTHTHSFCDDECRKWWYEDEQKRMRDEYLQLQGVSDIIR